MTLQRSSFWLVFFLACLSTLSCGKESACGKSTGSIKSFSRDLDDFTRLRLYDRIDIELKPSTVNRVTITCGEHLLKFIKTEVKGNELTIQDDNKCNFLRSYKKKISMVLEYTSLNYIYFEGAGTISSSLTINQPYLQLDCWGSSGDINLNLKTDSSRFEMHTGNTNLNLKGESDLLYLYSGGTSIVKAENLVSNTTLVNNSGTGDMYVYSNNYLFALVTQQGSIYYSGAANLDGYDEGKGEIAPF